MILKNAEKMLQQVIPSVSGNLWFVSDVNVTMDDDVTYEFKLCADVPVKSSINQQYYHMTKQVTETAKLKLHKMADRYGKEGDSVYELICGGQVFHGYCTDIDTMDKFILVLVNMMPNY